MGNKALPQRIGIVKMAPTPLVSVNYTKNFISFMSDCKMILEYCMTSLSEGEMIQIKEIHSKIIFSNKKQQYERKLFDLLLKARKRVLEREFEGCLLHRNYLKYVIHDYKYLQECFDQEKKQLDKEQIHDYMVLLHNKDSSKCEGEENSENIFLINNQEFNQTSDFFQDSFFRANSIQQLYLEQYGKSRNLKNKIKQQQQQDRQNQQNKQLQQCEMQKQKLLIHEDNDDHQEKFVLRITKEEFVLISRIISKYSHKIVKIHQLPGSEAPLSHLFWCMTNVKELRISAQLDIQQLPQVIAFLQDNSNLQKLQLSFKNEPTKLEILTLQNHPGLQHISLGLREVPSISLNSIKALKEVFVKSDGILQLKDIVQCEKILLKFEQKGFKFSKSSFELISPFRLVFISTGSSFQQFALSGFGQLDINMQIEAVKKLFDIFNSNILLDSCIKFTDGEDLQRMESKSICLKDYFYLYLAKLVVEFSRKVTLTQMQIFAFENSIAPHQFNNPNSIIQDLYFI